MCMLYNIARFPLGGGKPIQTQKRNDRDKRDNRKMIGTIEIIKK